MTKLYCTNSLHEDNLQQKTTTHDLKIIKVKYLSNHLLDPTQILNLYCKKVLNEDDLKWKTHFNLKRPQNIKNGISQQPLIGSY
jgi:hypothetical protein